MEKTSDSSLKIFGKIWNFLCGATPAVGAAVSNAVPTMAKTSRKIFATILFLAIIFLMFVLFLYVLTASSIMAIAAITGHWKAAMFFLVALLIWGMLSAIPAMAIFRPLNWISRWIARPAAIFLALYLLGGGIWYALNHFSPQLVASIGRSGNNTLGQIANTLDERSSHSEPEAGTIRKIKEDIYAVPDTTGSEPFLIKIGTDIKVINWNGKPATDKREGLSKIMIKNKFGHYDGGSEGWVPTRVLESSKSLEKSAGEATADKIVGKKREQIDSLELGRKNPTGSSLWLTKGIYSVVPDQDGTEICYMNANDFQKVTGGTFNVPSNQLIRFISTLPKITIYKEEK